MPRAAGREQRDAREEALDEAAFGVEHVGAERAVRRRRGRRAASSADRRAQWFSNSAMFGWARARASRARSISRPVASRWCRMRRRVCPPSRPSAKLRRRSRGSNSTPSLTQRVDRRRRRARPRTARRPRDTARRRPSSVSRTWASKESSPASTAAIPPCAQFVADSAARFLVTTATRPCSATRSAKNRPAMPLPSTRKSHWWTSSPLAKLPPAVGQPEGRPAYALRSGRHRVAPIRPDVISAGISRDAEPESAAPSAPCDGIVRSSSGMAFGPAAAFAGGRLYRYVDERGVVHFTNVQWDKRYSARSKQRRRCGAVRRDVSHGTQAALAPTIRSSSVSGAKSVCRRRW